MPRLESMMLSITRLVQPITDTLHLLHIICTKCKHDHLQLYSQLYQGAVCQTVSWPRAGTFWNLCLATSQRQQQECQPYVAELGRLFLRRRSHCLQTKCWDLQNTQNSWVCTAIKFVIYSFKRQYGVEWSQIICKTQHKCVVFAINCSSPSNLMLYLLLRVLLIVLHQPLQKGFDNCYNNKLKKNIYINRNVDGRFS